MPQIDVLKLISVVEDGLLARAKLDQRNGESDAKAFTRLYEGDIAFRREWAALTDAKRSAWISQVAGQPQTDQR